MRAISAALVALILGLGTASADTITSARFTEPTSRYAHGVLGDAVEWGALELQALTPDGRNATYLFRLPQDHVYEDLAPRLADVTGDGLPEVVVVETDIARGAALAIYDTTGKLAETPHIGQTNRWLAPIGAADLDSDGHIEIAYIDRPHLAKTLRIWRYKNGSLREVATQRGLSNHKIGWDFIAGGIRQCGDTPVMITANASWTRIIAIRFDGVNTQSSELGAYSGPQSLSDKVNCR
jgi:hypothetical protein